MTPRPATRVLVLGSPGSGKTTLARTLATRTGLPLLHLDDEYWGPGWTRPDPRAWQQRLARMVAEDRWIIDGNYLPSIPTRAARAEVVIVIDAPPLLCVLRTIRRALRIRRGHHEPLPRRVREQAENGVRVRATRDFLPLVRKVIGFRSRDWWAVIASARANPESHLIVAVAAGVTGRRVKAQRCQLHRRGVPATVVPLTHIDPVLQAWTGPVELAPAAHQQSVMP
ncbi:MAG TPA: AAA family ATPase [Micromonosporaceae bacterium]|nr:AAA family ATPase [Micromonosporaceae bacterium]